MANLPRVNLLQPWVAPSSGSEWVDNALPRPQGTHGRVYDPEYIMRRRMMLDMPEMVHDEMGMQLQPSDVAGMGGGMMGRMMQRAHGNRAGSGFDDTGFAGYLRDYYLPNTYFPKSRR
jgi:hypothetical protein